MLRLVHNQTTAGALLINDIDDGLPNKTAKRGVGDPKAYQRDGYANKAKQACYVPYGTAGAAGYIDLVETDHVLLSQQSGTIAGFARTNLLTAVSFLASDLVAPVLTLADLGTPGAGQMTITGTGMTSVIPSVSKVILTGTAAITLTQAQIVTGGGTFTSTSIVIPAALIPGVALVTTSAQIQADGLLSAVVVLT